MSYLESPRLHFAGRFQADTSSVNNDVRHYDSDKFRSDFQEPMVTKDEKIVKYNGYWNPQGTGAWRMLGCRVTSAVLGDRVFTDPKDDPAVGLVVGDAVDRVAGKLVDLDPQQQMVSQIWGLEVRLQDEQGQPAFTSDFMVSPFCNIWLRQQKATNWLDQVLGAAYQSVLIGVDWLNYEHSPTLKAMRAKSASGMLSISMNVFGYDRTPDVHDFGIGTVVGTIGPAREEEPKRFVLGRQLIPKLTPGPNYPFQPANKIATVQAKVDEGGSHISVDLGNALPIMDSVGTLEDLGDLYFGILTDGSLEQGSTICAQDITVLGEIDYRDEGWFYRTGGIVDFKLDHDARGLIRQHPVALVQKQDDNFLIMNRETMDGLFVRADNFVYRLNPGDRAAVRFYASCYGEPTAMTLDLKPDSQFIGGAGTSAKLPGIPVPDVNTPAGIVQYDRSLTIEREGIGYLELQASKQGPGTPRTYLDGQVYGIGYSLQDPPDGLVLNPLNFLSVLAWDDYEIPENPTWTEQIQAILGQYGNLYPIMSKRLVDLNDYDSVVAHRSIIRLSFSLPQQNPNYMPVTRDLSVNKRETLIKWLDSKDPVTGLPPYGPKLSQASAKAAPAPSNAESETDHTDVGSKVSFLREAQKHQSS